ncbi:hypothetical protein BU24DRAFT_180765 [Aaosphaeria arxii CBS 175.79]|uniref:MYND-type domain-containing protein n=1 Tax=Aaosphaeria arxii CBS 175.79 TaxID=1450172 RepID=A0A6A5XRP7_9PLEO|nr:uncharacterized protein BU24DRAFT_180765 [Aaosphaeria arxii CBS 175.79]KAF2015579.1 hypothetical protein BU24DRAFT_180765 [Aaosphaeria arxii CBS 175.79]
MAEPSSSTSAENTNTVESQDSSSTSAPVVQPSCAQCKKTPDSLKQCLKCHSVSYCNRDCQKAHFKTHKKECAALAQEYVKTHEPKMASRAPPRTGEARRGIGKWEYDT